MYSVTVYPLDEKKYALDQRNMPVSKGRSSATVTVIVACSVPTNDLFVLKALCYPVYYFIDIVVTLNCEFIMFVYLRLFVSTNLFLNKCFYALMSG